MSNINENQSVAKTNINWYPGHMAKTKRLIKENLNLIDIVYEVIDSRIPLSSKIVDIDDLLKNKPRILIMSKSDLCDKEYITKWIKYYEDLGYKVVLLDLIKGNVNELLKLTDSIVNEINEQRKKKGLKPRVGRILVCGIPNVGKSTLINKLVGKKAVKVGNKPGVTKDLSWIRVNKNLELMDSPGILWPKFEDRTVALNLASMSAIKEEILPIPEVASYILETLYDNYKNILVEKYGIDFRPSTDIEKSLEIIGKKRGLLIKGGEINYEQVYITIVHDLREGKFGQVCFDR